MFPKPGYRSLRLATAGLLLLVGCGAEEDDAGRDEPPPPTDYMLLTISGHCFVGCADFNEEYLVDEGTAQVLADALPDADGEVLIGGAVDSYWSWVDGDDNIVAVGFVDLVAFLEALVDDWPEKTPNETAVVVACHSHGCVWLHTALIAVPRLEIAALVDIDAESYEWEWEWADEIADHDTDWGWDIGNAESGWEVDGLSELQDVEDLVPGNVGLNLEIVSDDGTWIQDGDPNHRMDGSERRIEQFYSVENHEDSDGPNSDGISWAADRLAEELR